MRHLFGTTIAAWTLAIFTAAIPARADERVLLSESFGQCAGAHLPAGWSSSHSRFLLWPDFVATGDAAAARTILTGGLPLHAGPYAEQRSLVGLQGWTGSRLAIRWLARTDPALHPVAVRIDDVMVTGLTGREWADRSWVAGGTARSAEVVINEIMYAPAAGEPEWIEFLNAGENPVSLGGWTVSDASGARSSPLPAAVVPAGGTALVTRDPHLLALVRGEPVCEALALAGLPALNNGGDAVLLQEAGGATIDSVWYAPAWGGAHGRSLERRDPRSPAGRENWGECTDSSGATPCAVNSIAVLPVDVSLTGDAVFKFPYGTAAHLDGILRNVGSETVRDVTIRWFIDENRDGVPDEGEEIASSREAGELRPGDSLVTVAGWAHARPGAHQLMALAEVDGDGRPGNNTLMSRVIVGHGPGSVSINEIMYQPLPGESEYVELAGGEVHLVAGGWTLQLGLRDDGTPGKSFPLSGGAEAGVRYVVVAADSSILTRFVFPGDPDGEAGLLITGVTLGLGNGGDLVRLVDPSGGVVDSVAYEPSWHDPLFSDVSGRSLEKIHPRLEGALRQSWSTSVAPAGGTPGLKNSIMAPEMPRGSALQASPNPFSPDGDGREDHTVVGYRIGADAGYTIIRIFDVSGRLIRILMERERGGYSGEVAWDGRDDLSRRVRIGMYLLHLEAFDASGVMVASARAVVAVAGRL